MTIGQHLHCISYFSDYQHGTSHMYMQSETLDPTQSIVQAKTVKSWRPDLETKLRILALRHQVVYTGWFYIWATVFEILKPKFWPESLI